MHHNAPPIAWRVFILERIVLLPAVFAVLAISLPYNGLEQLLATASSVCVCGATVVSLSVRKSARFGNKYLYTSAKHTLLEQSQCVRGYYFSGLFPPLQLPQTVQFGV